MLLCACVADYQWYMWSIMSTVHTPAALCAVMGNSMVKGVKNWI